LKVAPVVPLLGHFNIATIGSGNYYLNVKLKAKSGEIVASNSLFFQRSNKNPVIADENEGDTGMIKIELVDMGDFFVSKYNVAQLKAILKMVLPISSPLERASIDNFLSRPQESYMRYFIYNFWKSRNGTDPEKEWQIYTDKVREVNKMFGSNVNA